MLNKEQKTAVLQIEGPVMVVAGPGTGKTQILAHRIAHILSETDCSAHNILCLTFTDAGTAAMKKRLLTTIGSEAHRVSIHTFHSFCNRVIQENPEYFEHRTLQPITALEKIQMLNDLALNLEQDHTLKKMKGNVAYIVRNLQQLFSWMKKEGVSSEEIIRDCEKYKVDIRTDDAYYYKRNGKGFKKGDLKMHLVESTEKKLDELAAGASLYDVFQKSMLESGKYDYDDMILWVLDLFRNDRNALMEYQEQFQYVLVDEFQDSSGAQNQLVELLCSYWDSPNLFVVGDDDQSIYKFQGAEIKNILDFADKYQAFLKTVVLKENYRSTQKILNAAEAHIEQNQNRLVNSLPGLDKHLLAQDSSQLANIPKALVYTTPFNEAYGLYLKVKDLIDSGADPKQIAIIYRKHTHADLPAQVLHTKGVPVYYHRSENILESGVVGRLLTVLKYLQAELDFPHTGESLLFKIMHQPAIDLSPLSIARFVHSSYRKHLRWREALADKEFLKSIHPISDKVAQQYLDLSQNLEGLIRSCSTLPLMETLHECMRFVGIPESDLQDSFAIECLRTFLSFVESECRNSPGMSVADLMHKIDLLEEYHISLSREHSLYDISGVQFMTAHASKGLEFDHVIIINCSARAWEKDIKRSPLGFFNIYEEGSLDNNSSEEKSRLFYVAMTRAKKTLTFTSHDFTDDGKDVSRSSFVDNLVLNKQVEEERVEHPLSETRDTLVRITFDPKLSKKDILDEEMINSFLENYQLSVSHMNSYLSCPTAFYFEQILKVPSERNKYLSFGTAIHRALDQLFKAGPGSENFNDSDLRKWYENAILRERFVFTDSTYADFLSLGKNVLTEYFRSREDYWTNRKDLRSEVVIDRVEIDGVPIKGQLDLMDVEDKKVQVVDFKTGDPKKAVKRLKPPQEQASLLDEDIDARYGGPYWRQMMFYALLVNQNSKQPLKMISGTFEFVEPDEQSEFVQHKIFIDESGLDHVRNTIKEVYQNIQNHQFSEGCGEPTCRWCAFLT